MPLVVDGIANTVDNQSVLEKVNQVIETIYREGRFVNKILINGHEGTFDSVSAGEVELTNDDRIEIQSYSLDELVQDSMESAADYVPSLIEALKKVVHVLRTGDSAQGASRFAQTIDGIQWNLSILSNLCTLHPGPSHIHDILNSGQNVVSLLMNAWDSQDFVLLADIIEYEALPWLVDWDSTIRLFKSQMIMEQKKAQIHNTH
jgi:hypothetical protein